MSAIYVEPVSDAELLHMVVDLDREMFGNGVEIRQRTFALPGQLMQRFGYMSYICSGPDMPPLLARINGLLRQLYRPQDFASGGHIGVFMYRDIFAKISVPWVFGTASFDPLKFVDLTELQRQVLASEIVDLEFYLDQFNDVADIQYGYLEVKMPFSEYELLMRFAGLAKLQLHAASAILTGGYDFRGASQSALLATELILKAAAAGQGLSEKEIKVRFGHDLLKLTNFVGQCWAGFDADRVEGVISRQPAYVPNRYASEQPSRTEVGHLVMGAQYIVSEIIRQISDRRFRDGMTLGFHRRYPA
ncbi:hypothetical protein [Brevundimonas subvibrioides]|uniref:hypothetical protein n=1 Tax=Brevundimonas subvibrioides TaxID=74313 RepID=UPI0032D57D91